MWLKFKENHWNVINTQDGGCPWGQGVGGTTEKWHQGGARGGSKGLRHVLFLKLSIWCSDHRIFLYVRQMLYSFGMYQIFHNEIKHILKKKV